MQSGEQQRTLQGEETLGSMQSWEQQRTLQGEETLQQRKQSPARPQGQLKPLRGGLVLGEQERWGASSPCG